MNNRQVFCCWLMSIFGLVLYSVGLTTNYPNLITLITILFLLISFLIIKNSGEKA